MRRAVVADLCCGQLRTLAVGMSSVSSPAGLRRASGLVQVLEKQLVAIQEAGTYKRERVITSPQSSSVAVAGTAGSVLNFCANNYLGLSNHPEVVSAAKDALTTHGYGLSSVRCVCVCVCARVHLHRRI